MSKREIGWLAVVLVVAAIVLHSVHYLLFGDWHHIAIYLLGDIAFLPLEVLFVTLVVDRVLSERERAARRHKTNMVVGVFFSELGRPLLRLLRAMLSPEHPQLALAPLTPQTTPREILAMSEKLTLNTLQLKLQPTDLTALQTLLKEHEELTLRLLANPVLLEHEEFSDVLWAVVHLEEELTARGDLSDLPPTDLTHLAGDAQRMYHRLLRQWLQYLAHLKQYYPYLYSFAVRADPLGPGGPVNVME